MKPVKTLYQYWEENNLPVKIHGATESLFEAYKYGASGHIIPLRKAFPEYFVDAWDVRFNSNHELFNPSTKGPMTFLTKAKELLTDRDYQLINPEDLKVSRANIQKRIRAYRDEITYSNDEEFKKAKSRRIEMLRIIAEELRMLIDSLKD